MMFWAHFSALTNPSQELDCFYAADARWRWHWWQISRAIKHERDENLSCPSVKLIPTIKAELV